MRESAELTRYEKRTRIGTEGFANGDWGGNGLESKGGLERERSEGSEGKINFHREYCETSNGTCFLSKK